MPERVSAGLVAYRQRAERLEVFLAHPGGPFFAHKDDGHWTIPKGEIEPGEELLSAARREFQEEIGIAVETTASYLPLGHIRQKGGKIVHAWAVRQDWEDSLPVRSNTFSMEWPPGSGLQREFPEVDRAQFFSLDEARRKVKSTQVPLLDRLAAALAGQ